MSSFIRKTKNPVTGKWEMAQWLDDYFGSHVYGVRFADGNVYNADEINFKKAPSRKLK